MTKKRLFCLGAAITLSSCVMIQTTDYPEDWPKPVAQTASLCPDISGIYQNQGQCEPSEGDWFKQTCNSWTLSSALLDWKPGVTNTRASAVDIRLINQNSLNITPYYEGKNLGSSVYTRNASDAADWQGGLMWDQVVMGYTCSNEGLTLASTFVGSEIVTTIGGTDTRTFTKLPNGDLMMKAEYAGGGHATAIPVMVKRQQWYRWKPAIVADSLKPVKAAKP